MAVFVDIVFFMRLCLLNSAVFLAYEYLKRAEISKFTINVSKVSIGRHNLLYYSYQTKKDRL